MKNSSRINIFESAKPFIANPKSYLKTPLVTVICLCYNQARFVEETLNSVIEQSYSNIEIIIVDDCSTDASQTVIHKWLSGQQNITFIPLTKNLGNTTAFNKGLAQAKGKYIIDLSCDDVLLPHRIAAQVAFFETQPDQTGVIYSDVQYVDESGANLGLHFNNHRLTPYTGNVFDRVIDTYFIPPPSMMMKKVVLDQLHGYDESLSYEDFDFWVRSAHTWEYEYQNEVLTKVRKVAGSHSTTLYQQNDKKLASTLKICHKIAGMATEQSSNAALINRLHYEIRHALIHGHQEESKGFIDLLAQYQKVPIRFVLLYRMNKVGVSFRWLGTLVSWIRS